MTLGIGDALTFTPEWWLLLGAAATFLIGRFRPRAEDVSSVVGLIALALAALGLLTQLHTRLIMFGGAFALDGYSRLLQGFILAAAAMCLVLTLADRTWTPAPDFVGFLLLATLAGLLAVGAADLVALAVMIALLGACLAVMAVAARPASAAAPAGVSAFIASTMATALLAYGFAFLYGLTGETALAAVGRGLQHHAAPRPALVLSLALIVAGLGILIGIVPVHLGIRAIFERAPLAVCAFTASVLIVSAAGALIRVLSATLASSASTALILATLAAVTMTAGNLAALNERSLRRLLAWVVIGQAGFGLVALVGIRHGGVTAALIFLGTLTAGSVAAVAAVIVYVHRVHSDRVADLSGMASYAPGAASVLALALASLAGLPPLSGFFGKLLVLQAAVAGGFAWLAVIGVANAVLAAVVAMRVTRAAFFDPPVFEVPVVPSHRAQVIALAVGAAAVVAFGAFLGPLYGVAAFGARAVLP